MLEYLDLGEENNEVLLLLHGLGQRKESWINQYELSKYYRLIIPDLTGHGENKPDLEKRITLESMSQDIIEMLNNLKITKIHICGLSLGGIIAQELYRSYADRVESLILCNTTFYIPSILGNKVIEKSTKVLERSKDELIERICRKDIFNNDFIDEAKQSFYISNSYLECSKVALGFNYFPVLLRCKVPVLLIGGLHDSTTPLFNTYIMKWAITKSKMVVLNAGHLSNFDCRDEFNLAIRRFIDKCQK